MLFPWYPVVRVVLHLCRAPTTDVSRNGSGSWLWKLVFLSSGLQLTPNPLGAIISYNLLSTKSPHLDVSPHKMYHVQSPPTLSPQRFNKALFTSMFINFTGELASLEKQSTTRGNRLVHNRSTFSYKDAVKKIEYFAPFTPTPAAPRPVHPAKNS